jgi:hypothetical protein
MCHMRRGGYTCLSMTRIICVFTYVFTCASFYFMCLSFYMRHVSQDLETTLHKIAREM